MMDYTRLVTALIDWFGASARDLPWRRVADPYAIWISEVMLQQTQVQTVVPYWKRWMRELPDIQALARAPDEKLLKLWEGLGYYRRARQLGAAARLVVARHDGRLPRDESALRSLPGIGRYTAGAIRSIAYDQPAPIVDGNASRVLARLFAIRGRLRRPAIDRKLWALAQDLINTAARTGAGEACAQFNQALMELGAVICTPRRPACPSCPVQQHCQAMAAGHVERYPSRGRTPVASARAFVVIVARAARRFCVRQRPLDGVNGGLWEFPCVAVEAGADDAPAGIAEELFGVKPLSLDSLGTVRHAITRYRITQQAFVVRFPAAAVERQASPGRWLSLAELDPLPFTGAHRRILRRLLDAHQITPTAPR